MEKVIRWVGRNWRLIILIIVIGGLASFFKGYEMEKNYQFNWDQERDAWVMNKMLVDHKPVLIGPRVVGEDGFFLGPFWYYFLVPFYWISGLDPIAGAWAAWSVGVVSSILLGYLVYKWFGLGTGFLVGGWWAMQFDRTAWNPMLVPIMSLGNLFVMRMLNTQSKKIWVWWGLIVGLGLQVHFQMIVWVAIWFVYSFIFFIKYKVMRKWIGLSVTMFGLTWLPLLMFDIRHNWINLQVLSKFILSRVGGGAGNWMLGWDKMLNEVNHYWILGELTKWGVVVVLLLGLGGLIAWGKTKLEKISFGLVVIMLPVMFGLYTREVSEYYFLISVFMTYLGLSYWFNKISKMSNKFFLLMLVLVLGFGGVGQWRALSRLDNGMGLSYKKDIVQILSTQNVDDKIFVSYSVDINYDGGFRYLIDWYGVRIADDAHLWTILMPPDRAGEEGDLNGQSGNFGVIRR